MTLFRLSFAFLLALSLSSSNAQQVIDLGVALFDQPDFKGKHVFFSENRDYETSFGVESIRIPPGWVVTVFTEINFKGAQMVLSESGNLSDSLKNAIKSIRIEQKNGLNAHYDLRELNKAPIQGYVTLFLTPDYDRTYAHIQRDWVFRGWFGIESILVPEGWEIWLYQTNRFEGPYLILTEDWDGNDPNTADWNDEIRSIRVVRKIANHPPVTRLIIPTQASPMGSVLLYKETDFKGDPIIVQREWNSAYPVGMGSIRIPEGCEVWVYKYSNFEGPYTRLHYSRSGIEGNDDQEWRNHIGSIRVVSSPSSEPTAHISPRIEVFKQANFQGNSCLISGNWSAHLSENLTWNNAISSLKIPANVRVVVFEDVNFQGKSLTITSESGNTLPDFWNNQIGSMQIFQTQ